MTRVNIHEAKTHLSKLIEKALNGEEVVIAKSGKPKVRLVPVKPDDKDWFGMDAGKIWIANDFDELPADIMAAFNADEADGKANEDSYRHAGIPLESRRD